MCKGDLILGESCVIILKWSKTLQDRQKVTTVTIPALGASVLCPYKALITLLQIHPLSDDHPLFGFYKQGQWLTLTDSMARKHLKRVCTLLGPTKHYTFHDFHRGGATWVFRHGVPIQDIQAQGTWSSQCVWRNIQLPPSATSSVANTFLHH